MAVHEWLTGDRLNSLEEWKANADLTIWQLTEQVRILTGQVAELRPVPLLRIKGMT